ncbi:GNAT family N-acetyltransferase [Actinoplanes italicus]|uniref:FR47-like protein n=1 Tax=Actinoplanes italicus TaxID=113567 RepID=A0A2T0K3B0_9ACTN|nr:GNAT family N-acetyltransferase [Actinoplanes italicus]PRX17343.1 FR47-like protein [Actinoplanes italicus]GIE35098.1 GNAT family N-acetyltransferase [Actinoplanes italicus]
MEELDDPVGRSLHGHHAHLARRVGSAATYRAGVARFAAVPPEPTGSDWDDLARLLGSGRMADLFTAEVTPPRGWEPAFEAPGFQMILDRPLTAPVMADPLGPGDVPDMLTLVEQTRPGPFGERTIEMGAFYGVRENGILIAMAGERLKPPGWTEISAVCTAQEARGRGLGTHLIQAAVTRILARGERPFLHVLARNTGAIRLYEHLGFIVRRPVRFHGCLVP